MNLYEIVLAGFTGESDETDSYIKFVRANTEEEAKNKAILKGWLVDSIHNINELEDFLTEADIDIL